MERRMQLAWEARTFAQLDATTLHDILRLRVDVFVVEQQCAYPELDGQDTGALHVIGRDAAQEVVAYARILPPGTGGLHHVGRVVVAGRLRGRGLGGQLMGEVHRLLLERFGAASCALAAQAHLLAFYAACGYAPRGQQYLLDGIPHVDMVRIAN